MAWPLRKQLSPPSQAERLHAWLIGRVASTGCRSVPIRTAMQHGPIGSRRVDHLDAALRELVATGEVAVYRQGRRRWIEVGRDAIADFPMVAPLNPQRRTVAAARYMRRGSG